jgi:tetratricopeptide (TPR) repeat protein
LLLLVDETKQVRLEVGCALEDVFADAFSGYVENLQLGPYYRAGDVGTGLLAGGAGAKRDLARYADNAAGGAVSRSGRGARSPEAAWEIMLAKWAGDRADIDVDIYTEMTRLAMGDADQPDPRTLKWLDHWRNADYQVLRDGNYAVIWFGDIDGWENSPFLFCNTGDGWKFDIVWQRRVVVMAKSPGWPVMQGTYPCVALMHEARQSTGKDLPLGPEDLYDCAHDTRIAARMAELEQAIKKNPGDAPATIELLRLSVIENRHPDIAHPLIKHARQLAPDKPEPYKCSAVYNVTAHFQYRTALEEMKRYIDLRPDDPFGHNLKGFLLYRLGRYAGSISVLEQAAKLAPDDSYAYLIMARDYALLARQARALNKKRYIDEALAMQLKAQEVKAPDVRRLAWLELWLKRRI